MARDDERIKKFEQMIAAQKAEIFRLKSIIDTLPVSVYWKNKEGAYLGFNKSGGESAKKFNLPHEEKDILGKTDHELFPKEMADVFRPNDLEIMRAGHESVKEEMTILPSGEKAVQLSTKKPLYDEKGNIAGVVGSTVDITYLKQIEYALLEAKEGAEFTLNTLNNIVANMPGHVYWKDKNGVYLGCNDRQAKSLGFNYGYEVIGKTDFDLPWGNDVARRFRENDIRIMKTGKAAIVEENAKFDGTEAIVLSQKTPLRDKQGAVVGVLGISIDITDRKKSEIALKEAKEDQFYKILNAVPASIYWKDKDGSYLGCNKYMLEMAGFHQLSEIIGKKDNQLIWKDISEKLVEIDTKVITNKAIVEVEETPVLANKEEKTFLTTKTPLRDINGEVKGLIGVSVDITERKKAEIALKEAKEKAEAANRAKTEFLENMRHDIRTPLIGITGCANIISDEVNDPKIKEHVKNLTASSDALLDLLNEILEFIRVSSGEMPLSTKKFDLKKRLLDIINLTRAKAKQKHLDLIFDYDDNLPRYVIGDATRVHRIILELVANALNFTDKGTITLTVQLAKSDRHDLVLKIVVEDTGIGIAPEQREEIFIQFKRLTPSYEGIYKGVGLGLALVKKFVDELEGEIYVESQVDKGTKFICLLPLKKALLDEERGGDEIIPTVVKKHEVHPQIQAAVAMMHKEKEVGKSQILLVEDQTIAATVMNTMLSSVNCNVDIAPDGKTAIQLAQENKYDLIFMDIGLPDIDGYEATKQIRLHELSKGLRIPIIALTAHVDEGNTQRCLDVGMNAVLSKPLAKQKAEEVLNAFIPRRKHSQQIKEGITPVEKDVFKIEGKAIDFEVAKTHLGGDENLVYELLDMLAKSLPKEVRKLQRAYKKEDWETIKDVAHKLRGGCSYCGTMRLKEVCARLEDAVKTDKGIVLTELYKQLLIEINAIEESIKNKDY